MNMFITSLNHHENVQNYCDVHLNKMIIEQAQLLSTAHRVSDGVKGRILKYSKKNKEYEMVDYNFVLRHLGEDGDYPVLYMLTHPNHPNNIWVRESIMNYRYAYHLLVAMLDEYEYRFNKKHATNKLKNDLKLVPKHIKNVKMTPFVYDEQYQYIPDVTDAYKKAFIDKFRDWAESNRQLMYNLDNPKRKRIVKMVWTNRPVPEFVDDETLDMIQSFQN